MKLSFWPKGLRRKFAVAFGLMSVLPLLVLVYVLANPMVPQPGHDGTIFVVAIAALLALLGGWGLWCFLKPVVQLATRVKTIVDDSGEKIEIEPTDEVASLHTSLNRLVERIKEDMAQMKVYGEQTQRLNMEIHRQMMVLSQLLHVSTLISQSVKSMDVIRLVLETLVQLEELDLACYLEPDKTPNGWTVRLAAGSSPQSAAAWEGHTIESDWLNRVLHAKKMGVVDHPHPDPHASRFFKHHFDMASGIYVPIWSLGQPNGLLICLSQNESFDFSDALADLVNLLGKQIGVALGNESLFKRAEEFKTVDDLTGLYNAKYMKARLEEEVQRAVRYNRSCALVVINLDGFRQIQKAYGVLAAEKVLRQVADFLKSQVSSVDRVGRMGDDEFALILPERSKREAMELAEAIRAGIEGHLFHNGTAGVGIRITVSAGVSENPLDGSSGLGLLEKAQEAVMRAKRAGKNQVVAG
jgi:diguanylate cyclase (GGDEF)-like protein